MSSTALDASDVCRKVNQTKTEHYTDYITDFCRLPSINRDKIRSSIPPPRLAEFHIPQRSSFYSAPEGEECVRDQGTHCVYGVPRFFFISNFIVNSRS